MPSCAGIVNRRGLAAGIDDFSLWSGTEARLRAYGTEELLLWFQDHPRITVTDYRRQISAGHRIQRDEAEAAALWDQPEDEDQAAAVSDVTEAEAEPVQQALPWTRYSDIAPVEIEWLWQSHIAAAEATIIAAPGGSGKTFCVSDIAARVTRGDVMPDGSPGGPPGDVIIANVEDDASAVMIHRLRAAGTDMGRVWDLSEVNGAPFSLPGCLPVLRQAIEGIGNVRMIVLDPLSGISDVSLTSVATVRREILRPLQALARRYGIALVMIHHVTKSGSMAGSKALEDGVRSVLMISRDPADPRIRTVAVHKGNHVAETGAMRYTITGEGQAARCRWVTDTESAAPQQDGRPRGLRVLDALRAASGPLTGQQIAAATSLPYLDVRRELARLEEQGLATSPSRGLYEAARRQDTAGAAEAFAGRMDQARRNVGARYDEIRKSMMGA